MSRQPLRKRIKYTLLYLLVRLLIACAALTPRPLWLALCAGLGRLAYEIMPRFRRLTIAHLSLALGGSMSPRQIRRLARRVYIMLGKNAGDALHAVSLRTSEEMDKFIATEGLENFHAAHAKGKGVIFLTCHLGSFELQAVNLVMRGIKFTSIGAPLKDPRLNRLLYAYRNARAGGSGIVRGKEIFTLVRILKRGEAIAVLIDQDTRVKSRFVNFFGMPASTPIGPALLALRTGAAVVPSYIYLDENNRQRHCIMPEMPLSISGDEERDVLENTQQFTAFIESVIRQHPEQWVWMHERWKTQPDDAQAGLE